LLEFDQRFNGADISIDGAFIGADYGVPTEEGTEAIRLLARTEAIFLDPVYSGKAMAALICHARAGELDPNEAVVFLHTGGGPSLFATGTTLV
jgi:1-aminocyclopropane-1-carboxylate deaminase/D-cysteine desulfhydrase-like pyridoxal-dependent ACC family enzyme